MMTKHGNTFAPKDQVQLKDKSTADGKLASNRYSGEVVDVDPDMEIVRVKWANGETTLEDMHKLERDE